ncbi:hypothetical protein GRS48_11900 [Halorubrum sp. JWXQ-INN 858]|uniref:hypothetical protein n=1 Tax=Halorubrum sp. JWXQ-INN 858 TaxID=2690782 RepID=UPI00135C4AC6|nr:hypothetical protein [Halorubrum sp. JWXQ-INN 858]MWV65515.1 hypothetical protein [Halorubrum sp. JWXQ-INN 858]
MKQSAVERRRRGPDVDVSTLLGDDHEAFTAVLSGEGTGPVAVVGDPFSGRGSVLDRAVRDLDATRVSLGPGDGVDQIRARINGGPIVIENCQHLYERRIGGFEELSAFLDDLASIDATVVTGWNRYAWTYLAAVQALGQEFPITVEVQPLPAERIAELVRDRYDEMPAFVADDPERDGLVVTTRHEVGWRDWSVSVPVPMLSPVAVRDLLSDRNLGPKDVTFGRLAAVSNGNLGVATAIWEARQGPEVRPSDMAVPASDRDLDREEAFCLRIVLAKERVNRAQLTGIVDRLDRVLGRLARDGLVTVEDDTVELVSAAVPAAVTATERGRIL